MSWSIPPEKPHCRSNDGNIHRTRSLKQDATGVSFAVPSRKYHPNHTSILGFMTKIRKKSLPSIQLFYAKPANYDWIVNRKCVTE